MVTHDPEEAMEISDQIAVMLGGKIVQAGSPKDIYQNPQSSAVAKLTSEGSVISAAVEGTVLKTKFGDWSFAHLNEPERAKGFQALDIFIRPFSIMLEKAKGSDKGLKLLDIRHIGSAQIVSVQAPCGDVLNLHIETGPSWQSGQFVKLSPRKANLIAFST